MTDTSLPSHQPASNPQSYVDSYVPPVTPVTPVQPQASTPAATTTDPLAELEKALQDYEARQKQLASQKQEVVQKTQDVVKQSGGEDPLAELERVLDEYEAKQKQSAPVVPTAPVGDTISYDEYKSTLKNEPAESATPTSNSTPATPSTPANNKGQSIEEQNIFELLGVMDADSAEKEAFLDELQQALWEDFLDKDLALLITPEQLKEIQDLRAKTDLPENERQEKLIQKVETIVPDIEEIMLEKALELKEDMVRERLSGMKEYYASRPSEMAKIQDAEKQILAGQWKAGAQLLNALTA